MALSLLHETVIRFIRRDADTARLALLVAECVPIRQTQLRNEVIRRVRQGLEEFFHRSSGWALEVREGGRPKRVSRLLLHRKSQKSWSPKENHGVWFVWDTSELGGRACGMVGIEWPATATYLSREALMAFFHEPAHTGGVAGRVHNQKKQWFALCPGGKAWMGWNNLLSKNDDQIRASAEETVELMKRLTEAIDTADPGR